MAIFAFQGVVSPEELRFLDDVFARACQALDVDRKSEQAETVAQKLVLLFQHGMNDRELLLAALVQPAPGERRQPT
jgi:hypothetical protein